MIYIRTLQRPHIIIYLVEAHDCYGVDRRKIIHEQSRSRIEMMYDVSTSMVFVSYNTEEIRVIGPIIYSNQVTS